ncbi:MAG: DUF4382 domain-containing protein, partial [Gammaproteobacteria bacterium]|nr:DUF4382 domain-containing protein [Gammaproteobacteria bacterium]
MNLSQRIASARAATLALAAAVFLAACGGGTSGSAPVVETPTATTGTFGLFITDKPSEDFAEINLDVTKAVLIGGDDMQQVLFDIADGADPREIDLLDLTNFNEPIVFGEVAVGTYTKLRLYIDNLELVPHDTGDGPVEVISIDKLPANGKIDLLDQDGFEVLPGATLLAEVDIDANKSIKVTGAGNSGQYKFRPVVKVQFSNDGGQDKLARFEGFVSDPLDPAGSFSLCATETAENCVDIMTGINASFFDIDGAPTDFTGVALDSPVVVIGRYQVDPDIFLDAIVVEIGGTAVQVKGQAVSNPLDNKFLLLAEDESDLTVELQPNTKYFDADGEIGADAIVLGAAVEVEGVLADPDILRAAFVFVEAEDDEQISGTINSDITDRTFELLLSDASTTVNVTVLDDADILLVDEGASEVTIGDITSLANGQSVELFGTSP